MARSWRKWPEVRGWLVPFRYLKEAQARGRGGKKALPMHLEHCTRVRNDRGKR